MSYIQKSQVSYSLSKLMWVLLLCWFFPPSLPPVSHSQFHVNELHWGCLIWSDYYAGWSHSLLQESTTLISGTQLLAAWFCIDTEKNKSVYWTFRCLRFLYVKSPSLPLIKQGNSLGTKSFKSEGSFLDPLASSLTSPHFSWHVFPPLFNWSP